MRPRRKRITKLQIGSTTYRVRRLNAKQDPDMAECLGKCDPDEATITLCTGLSDEVERTTLEHEAAGHGAFNESGAKYILSKFVEPEHLEECEELLMRTFFPMCVATLRGIR